MAEHSTVNRTVVGSSPTAGARQTGQGHLGPDLFCFGPTLGQHRTVYGASPAYVTLTNGRY